MRAKKAPAALLLDSDEPGSEEPELAINEAYAARFEHNKRREELHRLQEKHPELAAKLARKAAAEAARAARGGATAGGEDKDESEEASSSEDASDELELEADDDTDKVLETLVRIRRHDPSLYEAAGPLFPSDDEAAAAAGAAAAQPGQGAAEGGARAGRKREKPLYLRTVLAKQALEGGAGAGSDGSEGEGDELPRQPVSHSYAAEQQELKAAFLAAAAEAEAGGAGPGGEPGEAGALLRAKPGAAAGAGEQGADRERKVHQLLDEYFGADEALDPAGAFLKSFLANKAWKQRGDAGGSGGQRKRLRGLDGSGSSSSSGGSEDEGSSEGGGEAAAADDEEDEAFLEQADRFEAAYNFRFEEPGAAAIQGFPRVIAGSVRRPDERRKRAREAKAARKAAEREAREAEVKRLKNLKKAEIQSMFDRIQEEAGLKQQQQQQQQQAAAAAAAASAAKPGGKERGGGAGFAGLLDELLDGEFDPEEYDRRMAAAFDESYYEGSEEADELFGDREEELADEADVEAPAAAGLLDDGAPAAGFAALRRKLGAARQQQQQRQQQDSEPGGGSAGEEEGEEEGGGDRTALAAEQRSQLQRLLEDYYKLDCEDNIGGIPCRFRYRQVAEESFGLSVDDVLQLTDKQLNQIAGLRLLAPYREDGKRLRPNYKALQAIKGEAAAAAAMKQRKKEKQRAKEQAKRQAQQQQQEQPAQGDTQQQQQQQQQQQKPRREQPAHEQKQQQQQPQQRQRQQHAGGKRKREPQPAGQAGWQQRQQQQQQHSGGGGQRKQQGSAGKQKPLAQLSAEEKQAARLASYAKLTLRPSKDAAAQVEPAGGSRQQHKRRKGADGAPMGGEKQRASATPSPGRLAGVALDKPLSKAAKKNLLRSLKRKERAAGTQQ